MPRLETGPHLGEEEAADPVDAGGSLGDPVADEAAAVEQVGCPGGEGLEGGVGLAGPHLGDLVVEDARAQLLQVGGHDHQALEGLERVLQAKV